jgi:hypothetical protein
MNWAQEPRLETDKSMSDGLQIFAIDPKRCAELQSLKTRADYLPMEKKDIPVDRHRQVLCVRSNAASIYGVCKDSI